MNSDPFEPPSLDDLAEFFAAELQISDLDDRLDESGIIVSRPAPITCLGFALQTSDDLYTWLANSTVDALFLHRPFGLDRARLPSGIGVVACHEPFDAQLTTGPNAPLARALGMRGVSNLGEKKGRTVGMIGSAQPLPFDAWADRIAGLYGDIEGVARPAGDPPIARIAVMSAMDSDLVALAANAGAGLYLTGQFRPGASDAVRKSGIAVIAIGHARSEHWGLQVLARTAQAAFPAVETIVMPL